MNQLAWARRVVVVAVLALVAGKSYATDAAVAGDASVNSAFPSTNYGSLSNLYVGNGSTALIQFDLSSLPAGTTAGQIGKATLTVFVNRINTTGLVTVQPVTSAWTESTVTFAAIPTLGAMVASFTPAAADQFITVDVTSLVQGWVTTPANNFGIALNATAANVVLDAKESDETSHTARLDITVVSQGPQGIQGPTGPTGPVGATGATGLTGPQGIQGVVGPAGATGATGPPVTFRGTWAGSQTYSIGDTVYLNGTSYIALVSNQNINPATDVAGPGTTWALLALAGATGPIGPTGATGAQGIQGIQGSIGPQGLTGAQGPQGIQGPTGAVGATGPTGATGPQGIQGPTGATGVIASVVSYDGATPYTQGTVVTCVSTCVTNGSTYYLVAASATGVDPSQNNGITGKPWIQIAAAGAAGATGAGFANGTAAGQLYLTGAGPFAPAAPQTVTGDLAISPGAITTINSGAVTGGKIATSTITGANVASATLAVSKLSATGTPSSNTFLRGDNTWATPAGSGFVFLANFLNPEDNATYFIPPFGTPTVNAFSDSVQGAGNIYAPASCTVTGLFVQAEEVNATVVATDNSTFTVRHNGSNTSMTCTVNNLVATTGATATCSDTTHTFPVVAGDLIEFEYTQTNGANAAINYSTRLVCQ